MNYLSARSLIRNGLWCVTHHPTLRPTLSDNPLSESQTDLTLCHLPPVSEVLLPDPRPALLRPRVRQRRRALLPPEPGAEVLRGEDAVLRRGDHLGAGLHAQKRHHLQGYQGKEQDWERSKRGLGRLARHGISAKASATLFLNAHEGLLCTKIA